uniref:WH2 domain-containing protein n=1 Tax=Panagrellus redivivus TaxID=6233 RepID=A0A7E4VKA7_PANRE
MGNDAMFSRSTDQKAAYPPPHHAQLDPFVHQSSHQAPQNPVVPRSAASSTIRPKAKKEVLPPPPPPVVLPQPPSKLKPPSPPAAFAMPQLVPPKMLPPVVKQQPSSHPNLNDLFGDYDLMDQDPPSKPSSSALPQKPGTSSSDSTSTTSRPKSPLLVGSYSSEPVPKHVVPLPAVKREATPPLSPASAKRARKEAKKEKKEKKEK